ncbi:hypothetical protein ACFLTH_04700 [Bacteroidota bacterium]
MSTRLSIIILLVLSIFSFVSAQEKNEAFNTLAIGINAVKDFHENSFQKSWEPQLGIEGYFNTPFYLGKLHTGITYCAFGTKVTGYPDFKLFLVYLQWDYEFELTKELIIALGGRAGLSEMRFNENDIVADKNLLNETEFTAGMIARLSYEVIKDFRINLSSHYLTIFTYPQMNSLFIGAGISKTFSTPGWLKEFLK